MILLASSGHGSSLREVRMSHQIRIGSYLNLKRENTKFHILVVSHFSCICSRGEAMAGKALKFVAKAVGEYQYPWQEKLAKYKDELSKGVWGYWELGSWQPLGISARRRAQLRKEVLVAGADWPYDPERKEMKTRRKGHKVDRLAAEKRERTTELMEAMPQMLADYRKRKWERKMKAEDDAAKKAIQE